MTRSELLREQAEVLWRVAESSALPEVRREARHLAAVCEDKLAELRRSEPVQHEADQPPS